MWTWFWGAAVAGTLGENLEHVGRSPLGVAMSCADGGAARVELARLGPLLGHAGGLGDRLAIAFRPGIPVVSAVDPATHRVEVAFPSALGAEPVAQAFAASEAEGVAAFTADGWRVTLGDDVWRVAVAAGWAHLALGPAGAVDEPVVRGGPVPLLQALPHDGGCLVLGRIPPDEDGQLGGDFGVHFPFGGEDPIRFAVTGAPAELASVVPLDPRPAPAVRTRLPVAAVASVGVAFDKLDLRFFLRGAELARGRALLRALPVRSGALVAIVGEAGTLQVAAVLPLAPVREAALPRDVVVRRAARALRALRLRVERLDALHLRADLGDGDWLWVGAAEGAVYLSTGPQALAELERGEGDAWATGAFADQAGRFPLVLSSWVAPGPSGEPVRLGQALSLAVGVHGGVVSGELVLPLSPLELLGLLAGLRSLAETD